MFRSTFEKIDPRHGKPNFLTRIAIPLLMGFLIASTVSADVIHDESSDGDLSDNNLDPTALLFDVGSNQIIGSTTFDPLDRDFWTFEIGANQQLDSILLQTYDTTEDQSFFAVGLGPQIASTSDASGLLGSSLIGSATGRQLGDDVLDDLGDATLGGSGFTGPLGPGQYTFWFQETAADTNYAFEFNISSAVPEPTSVVFLGWGGALLLLRRRRNS